MRKKTGWRRRCMTRTKIILVSRVNTASGKNETDWSRWKSARGQLDCCRFTTVIIVQTEKKNYNNCYYYCDHSTSNVCVMITSSVTDRGNRVQRYTNFEESPAPAFLVDTRLARTKTKFIVNRLSVVRVMIYYWLR